MGSNAKPGLTVEEQVNAVGHELSSSFRALFQEAGTDPAVPQNLTRSFGTNAVFSHRLSSALRKVDPLATMLQIPGPQPLRQFIQKAEKKGVAPEIIEKASRATDDFEHLIRHVAGDRSNLDVMVGAWLPDARTRYELAAKQSAYRGMCQLRGIAADVEYTTVFFHAGSHPDFFDSVILRGMLGFRRIRPGVRYTLPIRQFGRHAQHPIVEASLDDVHLSENPRGMILDQFCSDSLQPVQFKQVGGGTVLTWDWADSAGIPSSCDLVFANLRRNVCRRHILPDSDRLVTASAQTISVPTRVMYCDLLLGEGVYPGWIPNIRTVEIGQGGIPDPQDELSDCSILDTSESIDPLGVGIGRFRAEDIPNYTQILEHACQRLGWDPASFRGYRTRIEYPIFGTAIQSIFPLASKP